MKSLFTTIVLLLIGISFTHAQQGINYKALIKDNNGNIVANQAIDIRFSVIADAGPTIVYQETHSGAVTDNNGIVIVNIGEGIPIITDFSDIDWGSDTHSLQVEIDIEKDASYVDLGTTPFMAVPYALYASRADYNSLSNLPSITNPTGLEAIDEGNGVGYRLINKNPANYGNIGLNAVDISESNEVSTTYGATGAYSFATGSKVTASAAFSTAMGDRTISSGYGATAMGQQSEASGFFSTAIGNITTSSGDYSTALGNNTTASGSSSTAMGYYSTASGNQSTTMGNNTTASAVGATAFGNFTTASGNQSTAIGVLSVASGNQSIAMGAGINAQSNYSIGVGRFNIGGGNPSSWISTDPLFEVGNGAADNARNNALTILKNGRVGIGTNTPNVALSVKGSLNLWEDTTPASLTALRIFGDEALWYNGTYFSWGFGGSANYFADNVGIGTTTPDVPLQIATGVDVSLANGTGQFLLGSEGGTNLALDNNEIQARNNGAASVLYLQADGGKINIGNSVVIEDTVPLRITNASDASLANGSGYLVLGSDTGTNVVFDNNEIQARNNGAVSNLTLQYEGGNVNTGANLNVGYNAYVQESLFVVNGDIWLNGGIQHYSDKRLKRDIENISYGLKDILKLRPTEYFWKDKEQEHKSLGLIAQEVDQVIKNVVTYEEEKERYGVSYTELIPVLIKAIQEQQDIINNQDQKINQLNTVVAEQDVLNKRLERLEALINNQ